MAETFPLPRSSFKLLRLILIGYLHEGGKDRRAAGPTDVGRAVGLDQTLVSRNNAALAALGMLEREGRKWKLTDRGETVARAFEYEAMDEVRETLGELLRTNEYIRRVITFVRGRGGVDEEQIVSHLARTAGVKRTAEFLTGARALLELLYIGGVLEVDGDVVRVPARQAASSDRVEAKPTISSRGVDLVQMRPDGAIGTEHAVGVTLHVNLTPADFKTNAATDSLVARIRHLLDSLSNG